MADTTDDIFDAVVACSSVHIASAAALLTIYAETTKRRRKRKHRVWVSRYLVVRPQYGAYNSLMRDLLELDNAKFRNYIRMEPAVFEELFTKVEPLIQ